MFFFSSQAKDHVTILPFQVLLLSLLMAGVEPSLGTVALCEAFVLGNTLASVALLSNDAELDSSTLCRRHPKPELVCIIFLLWSVTGFVCMILTI